MQPFIHERGATVPATSQALRTFGNDAAIIAGGTTLVDLMKLDVLHPARLVDITRLPLAKIDATEKGIRLGALVTMASAASHPQIVRNFPLVAQSLLLAASGQIRNMATLGGNVLQRTRCSYFRDVTVPSCNKRLAGSGCAALEGMNRMHAVLGTSEACIATYPGDFAQALMVAEALVEIEGAGGKRVVPFASLHLRPDSTPSAETTLAQDEIITGFVLPNTPWMRRSLYLKVRDRDSYAYALASVAVALDMERDTVAQARIALGGMATVPWRAHEAEAALKGKKLDEAAATIAANAAFAGASPREHNRYKPILGRQTIVRALLAAKALEI